MNKIITLTNGALTVIVQHEPKTELNRAYVVRNQIYLGSFENGKFILKESFQWASGYAPKEKDLEKLEKRVIKGESKDLLDPVPEMPSEEEIKMLEGYLRIGNQTLSLLV